MPLPLLLGPILAGIGAGVLGATVITLVVLYWNKIVDWFQSRTKLKQSDKDIIAFTIKQELEKGRVPVVQGMFNKRTNEVVDGQKYAAEKLDEQLEELHRGEPLVIYE